MLSQADWCRQFLPHYGFGRTPGADFHGDILADLDGMHRRRRTRRAFVAPRDGAKSTVVTFAYVLRCAVERWEPHVLILSESDQQAGLMLANIRAELEGNPRLSNGYPDATGVGPEWASNRVRMPNGVLVEALGRGVRIRGRRNRQARPSLVILDDVQGNRDIESASERRRAWNWFTREVIPAGDQSTNFVSVGSALHREAIAVRAQTLPGWTGRTFKAIHQFPERLDLWEECERVATNLADPHRDRSAREYFEMNRREMLKGFLGYWPAKWSAYDLMMTRAQIGRGAFDTEYQGNPYASEHAEFPAEWFEDRPGRPFWFRDWPDDLVYRVVANDPSKGRTDRSDWQAFAGVGLDPHGTLWVDCLGMRTNVPEMCTRGVEWCRQWGRVDELAVETNQGLDLLVPEYERAMRAAGVLLPLKGIEHYQQSKEARIRRLGTYFSRGQVRVRRTKGGQDLVDQLRDFPDGEHDDHPDAVELGVKRLEQLTTGV